VGFVSFTFDGADCRLALGLHPEVMGKGIGESFVSACIEYARNNHKMINDKLKLLVACFNQRAIRVYQRVGFKITRELERETHIGLLNFIEMEFFMPKQLERVSS